MVELADAISRQADELATTFARVDDAFTRSTDEEESGA
jgi:hypothetical protein